LSIVVLITSGVFQSKNGEQLIGSGVINGEESSLGIISLIKIGEERVGGSLIGNFVVISGSK
jgi:hypothetical protein